MRRAGRDAAARGGMRRRACREVVVGAARVQAAPASRRLCTTPRRRALPRSDTSTRRRALKLRRSGAPTLPRSHTLPHYFATTLPHATPRYHTTTRYTTLPHATPRYRTLPRSGSGSSITRRRAASIAAGAPRDRPA
eukprot:421855-Prymnesium_polylepis.1